MGLNAWRKSKARIWQISYSNYIRFTPDFGFSFALSRSDIGLARRIRCGWVHGVQIVMWQTNRWIVVRQLLGKNRVKGGDHLDLAMRTRRK